jgi:hypothetical protein
VSLIDRPYQAHVDAMNIVGPRMLDGDVEADGESHGPANC